jgi:hypothetical protein
MTEVDDSPDDSRIRELLREARLMPALPLRFREAVWRRIQQREPGAAEDTGSLWIDRLVGWLLRPRVALAGLAVVVLVSGGAGLLQGTVVARQTAQARYLAAVAPFVVR